MTNTSFQLEPKTLFINPWKRDSNYLTIFCIRIILIFFLLMLVTPASNQFERGLALLAILVGSTAFVSFWRLDKTILYWLLITTSVGLYSLGIGIFANLENALRHSTIYIVWPIIFVYFIGFATKPEVILSFSKTIIIGVFLSSIMGIFLVMSSSLGLYSGFVSDFFESQGARTGFHDGYVAYRLYNVSTLIYGIAFMYVIVSDNMSEKWVTKRWKLFIYITTALLLLATLVSGRRAAWVTVLIAPAVHLLIARAVGHKPPIKRILFAIFPVILIFIAAVVFFDLNISELFLALQTVVDFKENASNIARAEQLDSLLAGWANNPFFGNGLGTSASILRSDDIPWAYELSYIALLFHVGIFGLLVYFAAIIWIFVAGCRSIVNNRRYQSILLPLLTGLGCFLIANASNPYLSTFDCLWTIFLPLSVINSIKAGYFRNDR